ncbi:hypothetical protein F4802DRAFT_596907 [Xylaria palmicola]|nr:hypothetical protein F4802DRAFT_596907 [Xylaria palmicola]
MVSSMIKNLVLLAFAVQVIALPLNADKREPKQDITFKYPIFKAEGGEAEKRSEAITFKYPFKASEDDVEKRSDAITFKYPIFKANEAASQGDAEKRSDAITFKYPIFKANEAASQGDAEKRSEAITFKYPIFKASEGTAEKREPKSPYADAIAAADPRDILG